MKNSMFGFSDSRSEDPTEVEGEPKRYSFWTKLAVLAAIVLGAYSWYREPKAQAPISAGERAALIYVARQVEPNYSLVASLPGHLTAGSSGWQGGPWHASQRGCGPLGFPDGHICYEVTNDSEYVQGTSSKSITFTFFYDESTKEIKLAEGVTREYWRVQPVGTPEAGTPLQSRDFRTPEVREQEENIGRVLAQAALAGGHESPNNIVSYVESRVYLNPDPGEGIAAAEWLPIVVDDASWRTSDMKNCDATPDDLGDAESGTCWWVAVDALLGGKTFITFTFVYDESTHAVSFADEATSDCWRIR